MSHAKRAREKEPFPNSVVLFWALVTHKAYLDLSPSACKELPFFMKKVKKKLTDPERYLVVFEYSYREAARYGFATTTHYRTICKLVANGIIDPVAKGGLKSDRKSYNRFRLSERWIKYGTSDFVEFKWKTFQKIEDDVNTGNPNYCYSVKNGEKCKEISKYDAVAPP